MEQSCILHDTDTMNHHFTVMSVIIHDLQSAYDAVIRTRGNIVMDPYFIIFCTKDLFLYAPV